MTSKTIKEKLDSMPIEEYELLLKGCTDKSKTTSSEHKEIINQLEYQMKTQPEEAITSLTNSKHSSSLQSLDQKEKVKKVPCGTVNLNQQQKNQNLTNNSSSGTNNLPAQYYFNCIQDIGQPYSNLNQETARGTDRENNSESHSAENASLFPDLIDERTAFRNKSNIQLSGNCKAVLSVTDPNSGVPTGSSNDRTHVNESSLGLKSYTPIASSLKSATSNCPTVTHFTPVYHSNIISPGSPPPSVTIRGSSESSRRLDETAAAHGRKKGKTKDKDNKRETSFTVPQDKEFDLNEVIKFVEGESLEGKRGNKNKKKGVKSMSLDDDNLSIAAKKTEKDRGDRSSSVKTTSSTGSAAAATTATTNITTTTASISSNPNTVSNNNNNNQSSSVSSLEQRGKGGDSSNNKEKKGKEVVVIESELSVSLPSTTPPVAAGSSQGGIKKSSGQIISSNNTRERKDGEDSRSPVPIKAEEFKLVIRKRKNKTVSTSSSSGNTGGREEEKQDVDSNRKGRSRGERRKSVGSVPGSDQSEGSDDGSVRSLPAGQCTKRENVPKSCASSGGTPQTSYADIARLTKDEDVKKEVPQAPEDYPSLHGFENSEGSDDGSDRSAPPPPLPVADETVAPKEIVAPAVTGKQAANVNNTPQTSWAYIARLHSSTHEEKKEDNSSNKKEQQSCDDFPELNSTVSAVSHDSAAELLPSPKSDLSASMNSSSKCASSDSAFPQLIASKQSNSLPQGISNTKTMSSVLPNSTVTPKVANAVPAAGTPPTAGTKNATQGPTPTQKAQQTFSASPTVTLPPSTVTSQAKSSVNTTAGAGANIVTNVNVANSRVLRSPPTVSVNCMHVSDGTNPSKTNVHVSNNSSSALSNAQKDLPPSYVNGHLSESERDKVMKRSDIPGAKMDKSSFSINQPPPLNVDSVASQCTEAVVFCGENFKEPPQLPSKDLQFEFGFNVNEVLVDMNKKVSPDVVVPAKNISVKHTKAKNAPSPPPKDGVQASKGGHGPPSSSMNKQQSYAPRPQREDGRSRDFEKNGTRFQNNRNEHNQGPRRMPAASANNEGDDTSKPASVNYSDAQVVVSANRPVSSGIPPERSQSYKATQAKVGHNPKKPFQTVQPAESAPSATPSEIYSKSAILTQYPVTTPTMPVHPGGHGVPPVYGMPSFVTSTPPPNYPNRLPTTVAGVPSPVTGTMVPLVLPAPYDATQPPQYVLVRAPAPVANATTGEDHHSTIAGNNTQQLPQTGGSAPNPEYITTVSAAGGPGGPGQRQAHSATSHGQYQHHQRGSNQVPAHNYRANVVDVTCSVPTSEPPLHPPKEVSSAAIVTGSLTYPINFAPHYVSPDPARYSSVNVDDLRNYLGRRQQECQRLKGSVREIT